MTPVMPLSAGGLLTPINSNITNDITGVSSSFIPTQMFELLNSITCPELKVKYRFTRSQHLVSTYLITIELTFSNAGNEPIKEIQMGLKVNFYHIKKFIHFFQSTYLISTKINTFSFSDI